MYSLGYVCSVDYVQSKIYSQCTVEYSLGFTDNVQIKHMYTVQYIQCTVKISMYAVQFTVHRVHPCLYF